MSDLQEAFSAQTLSIGGFAVVAHSGNWLSDWMDLRHLAPTEPEAMSFAQQEIGAFTLEDGLARLKKHLAERGEEYEPEHDSSTHASVHALSPGLYAEFTKRLAEGKEGKKYHTGGDLARELLEFDSCPRYEVNGKPVYCTDEERDALDHFDEDEYLDEDEKIEAAANRLQSRPPSPER
jgi:hypothetical protein